VLVAPLDAVSEPGNPKRVAETHEVINLPSMTALSLLRYHPKAHSASSKELLVFADPVFERDDPRMDAGARNRLARPVNRVESENVVFYRGAAKEVQLPRLVGTRREAMSIAKIAGNKEAELFLGFDANRERATSQEIERYRIIHFATHSIFDDQNPESSSVVLSLFDARGFAQDGYLRLRDIYNLRLSAELVVLSACDTALGKDIKGEGIVGLTRGFMYAGVPHIVATLWKVDDEPTSEFMKQFYESLLQKHLSASASLREAQMVMSKKKQWHSPYNWGAFVIEGDWR
jgi:CHAT domain-containing protein